MASSGFVAFLAGWVATEVARQHSTVQGLMTTAESASALAAPAVDASLLAFWSSIPPSSGAGAFHLLRMTGRPVEDRERIRYEGPIRTAGVAPSPQNAPDPAFPLAYVVVTPALCAPIVAMPLGLVFRSVAFGATVLLR